EETPYARALLITLVYISRARIRLQPHVDPASRVRAKDWVANFSFVFRRCAFQLSFRSIQTPRNRAESTGLYRLYVIKVSNNKFAYVISPFFEYISITRYKDGEYRNYLFKYEGYKYSYNKAADNPDLPSFKFAAYRNSSLTRYPTFRNKNKEALPNLPLRK